MAFFVNREPVSHTITDPDTGETATVQIVELNAGDLVGIQDSIRVTQDENDDMSPEFLLGTMKMLQVEKALVGWSLDGTPTANTIANLDPRVFEQIATIVNGVSKDSDPLEQDVAS